MFERLGRAMYRARWRVIIVWSIVLLLAIPLAPEAGSALKGGGFANGVSEADSAASMLVSDMHFYRSSLTVIFTSPTLKATDPRFRQAMAQALQPAARMP